MYLFLHICICTNFVIPPPYISRMIPDVLLTIIFSFNIFFRMMTGICIILDPEMNIHIQILGKIMFITL